MSSDPTARDRPRSRGESLNSRNSRGSRQSRQHQRRTATGTRGTITQGGPPQFQQTTIRSHLAPRHTTPPLHAHSHTTSHTLTQDNSSQLAAPSATLPTIQDPPQICWNHSARTPSQPQRQLSLQESFGLPSSTTFHTHLAHQSSHTAGPCRRPS